MVMVRIPICAKRIMQVSPIWIRLTGFENIPQNAREHISSRGRSPVRRLHTDPDRRLVPPVLQGSAER